jgi:phosphate transport system protein
MANHLRYIVAIINSIKDLERIADYGVSAVRFFVNNSVSDDIRSIIQSILNDALKAMNKIFHAIHNKTAIDSYKECQKIHADFKEKYNHIINKLSGILKRRSAEQIEKLFQGAIIIIKHIERIIDHCSNITENFMFIKESEFFFNKHSKQI